MCMVAALDLTGRDMHVLDSWHILACASAYDDMHTDDNTLQFQLRQLATFTMSHA